MVRYQPPMDWQEWVNWLAAGLHGRSRWRLSLILMGMLFAKGRRTVTTWLRAAGIHDDFADYYYFLQPLGARANRLPSDCGPCCCCGWCQVAYCWWSTTRRPSAMGRKCKARAFITIPRPVRPIGSFCTGTFG